MRHKNFDGKTSDWVNRFFGSFKIQPGTKCNSTITITGKGIEGLRGRGDFYGTISIEVPDNLNEEQEKMLKKLGEIF